MTDLPPYPDSKGNNGDDKGIKPDHGTPPGTPRWVKVIGIITLVLFLLIVIALVSGLGGPGAHGPGRHMPSGDVGIHITLSNIIEDRPLSTASLGSYIPPFNVMEDGL